MKRTLRALATAGAAAALIVGGIAGASAADYVTASPNTGVKAGDVITVTTTGLTGTVGVYASLCKGSSNPQAVPTDCDPDQSHMVWITGTGAQGSNKEVGKITAITSFTSAAGNNVDCLVDACVIYVRGDHNNATAYNLIRALPIGFAAGQGGVVKKTDVATATLDGVAVKANVPGTLAYRVPVQLVVTAESGLPVTLRSLTPDCAVEGTKVTALTGKGQCAIAAVTTGNDVYAAFTAAVNFPFYLTVADQAITGKLGAKKVAVGKSLIIKRASLVSNMGEGIALTSHTPRVCSVKAFANAWAVTAKKVGTCKLTATSPGLADKYKPSSASWDLAVQKK